MSLRVRSLKRRFSDLDSENPILWKFHKDDDIMHSSSVVAREARKNARKALNEETKAAYENMKIYKFYHVASPNSPDVSLRLSRHKI